LAAVVVVVVAVVGEAVVEVNAAAAGNVAVVVGATDVGVIGELVDAVGLITLAGAAHPINMEEHVNRITNSTNNFFIFPLNLVHADGGF
jgi:hypothetical protein